MADTRSGSQQTLRIAPVGAELVTVAEPGLDSGFGGLNLNFEPATFENKSGGLTTTFNSGTVVSAGDFTINENERTLPLLLGMNGQRFDVSWIKEGTSLTFEAVFMV